MEIQPDARGRHLYECGYVKVGKINPEAIIPEQAEQFEIARVKMIKHPKQDDTKKHYPEFDCIEVKVGKYL